MMTMHNRVMPHKTQEPSKGWVSPVILFRVGRLANLDGGDEEEISQPVFGQFSAPPPHVCQRRHLKTSNPLCLLHSAMSQKLSLGHCFYKLFLEELAFLVELKSLRRSPVFVISRESPTARESATSLHMGVHMSFTIPRCWNSWEESPCWFTELSLTVCFSFYPNKKWIWPVCSQGQNLLALKAWNIETRLNLLP